MSAETIDIKIDEILQILNDNSYEYEYRGASEVRISGFSDPSLYMAGTAIWLGSVDVLNLSVDEACSDVTLLFAKEDLSGIDLFPNVIVCDDPRNAFMSVVESVAADDPPIGIDPTAIVSDKAIIGDDCFIGPHVVIEAGAQIGPRCRIHDGSTIRGCVTVGNGCTIFDGCVIGNSGFGFRKSEEGLVRMPHLGGVRIGNRVEVGANSVIDRGTFRDTVIGDGTKIDSLTTIGHNAHIGQKCLVIGGCVGGNTSVGDRCELIHAQVKNRISIGSGVKVGIGSVVIRDLPDGAECFGVPARVIKH